MANDFIINNGVLEKYVGSEEKVIIPDSVIKIGERAFENSSVKEVSFSGNNLRSIENYAFYGCKNLLNLQIPDGTIQIGDHALSDCEQLRYIIIPESVIDAGEDVLTGCHNDLFIIGSKKSEAESIAKAYERPFHTSEKKAIKEYKLLQEIRENSKVRSFDIFGEEVSCFSQLKMYEDILAYYRKRKGMFCVELSDELPLFSIDFHGNPDEVLKNEQNELFARMKKLGLTVKSKDVSSFIAAPLEAIEKIFKTTHDVRQSIIQSLEDGVAANRQSLFDAAERKITGLNYGVIGDSFDLLFYEIDNINEKKRQRKEAYAEAENTAEYYRNELTDQAKQQYWEFIEKIDSHLRKAGEAYLEGLRQAEISLLVRNGIFAFNPEEEYDIKKSVQIMKQISDRKNDNRLSVALALKKYPWNIEAMIYAVEHDYTCLGLTELMDFLNATKRVNSKVKRRKQQKQQALLKSISDEKNTDSAIALIRRHAKELDDSTIQKVLTDISLNISYPLRNVFQVEKLVNVPDPEAYVRQIVDDNLSESSWKFFAKYGVSPLHSSAEIPEEYASSREVLLSKLTEAFIAGNNACKAAEEAARIERERLEELHRQEKTAQKKRTIKTLIVAGSVLVAVVLVFVILTNVIIPTANYNNALKLKNEGNIVESYEKFISLDGFKDSDHQADSICKEYWNQKLPQVKVGDYITFGKYEQDNKTSNGKENIEWLVLESKGDKVFIISRHAIDYQKFSDDKYNNVWASSTLRNWLNNDFINSAFSAEEKTLIPMVTVSADRNPNPNYSSDPGPATQDQVYLLSVNEANKYLNLISGDCYATDYVVEKVENESYFIEDNLVDDWWLRTPAATGEVEVYDSLYKTKALGEAPTFCNAVRPAMWIDLNG